MRQVHTTHDANRAIPCESKPKSLEWPTTHTTMSVVLPFLPDSVTQRNTILNSMQRSPVADGWGQGLGKITVHSENLRRQIASARTQKEMEGRFAEGGRGRDSKGGEKRQVGRGEKTGREEERRNGILKLGPSSGFPTTTMTGGRGGGGSSVKKEVVIVEETKHLGRNGKAPEDSVDADIRPRRSSRNRSPRRNDKEGSKSPPQVAPAASKMYPNTNTSRPNTPLRSYYDRPDDGIPYSHRASLQARHRREDELRHAAASSRRRRLPAMKEGAFPERQIITHLDESTQAKLQEAAKRDGEIEGAMNAPGGAVCIVGYESMEEKGFGVDESTSLLARPAPPPVRQRPSGRRPPTRPPSLPFRTPITPSDLDVSRREGRFGDKNTENIISAHSVLATAVAAAAFSDANLLLRPPDDLSLQYRLCELDLEERSLKQQFQQILSHYQRKDERGKKLRSNRNRKEYRRLQEWIKQHGADHAGSSENADGTASDGVRCPPIAVNVGKRTVRQLEEAPVKPKKWIRPSKHVTLNNPSTQEARHKTVPLVG